MVDEEYEEPTNAQLANFLVIYAPRIVGEHSFDLNPTMLEELLDRHPMYRISALKHHRKFIEAQKELWDKMERGKLRCAHIRDNGKKCPNWNEPGSFFCGLHKEEHEGDSSGEDAQPHS